MNIFDRILSRRQFIRASAGGSAAFLLLPYTGCDVKDTPVPGAFLSKEQQQAAQGLADIILPPDNEPGGANLGIVPYLEQLLTAFDSNPPKIFAAGPNSGRHPFTTIFPGEVSVASVANDFRRFVPLTRAQEASWRLYLYGSDGVPGGGPNDHLGMKAQGLRNLITTGLDQALKLCPKAFDKLPGDAKDLLLRALDGTFFHTFAELVIESSFAAPEYGGNQGLVGWRIVHFEGDVQPWGYTFFDTASGTYRERPEAPVSTASPGADPDPFSSEVRLLLDGISLIEGKLFKMTDANGAPDPAAIRAAEQAAQGGA